MANSLWGDLLFWVWLVCGGMQLYYWLHVFLPLRLWRNETDRSGEPVSVVICVHEMTSRLPALLENLKAQQYPVYEVVVVNDGPDNAVSELIRQYQNGGFVREVLLDATHKKAKGKKEALALGIEHAMYDWVLLTDADCGISIHWIRKMMAGTSPETRVVLGVGPLERSTGFVNRLARYDNLLIAMLYLGLARKGKPYMGVGRNLLYDKALYRQAGGFKSHMHISSGDDDLFVQHVATAKNTGICLDPESFAVSPAKPDLRSFLYQKRRHVSTGQKYARHVQLRLGLFNLSFMGWWLLAAVNVVAAPSTLLFFLWGLGVLVQWLVFMVIARKLHVKRITSWFVPLSFIYAFFLIALALLMMIGPPQTWKKS